MQPLTRFFSTLALAASCVTASGQLPVPPAPPTIRPQSPTPPPPVIEPARPDATLRQPEVEETLEVELSAPSEEQLKKLTQQLGNDDFKARETAQIELSNIARQHPEATLDTLLEQYLNSSVHEARYRLRSILYSTKQAEYMKVPRGFVGIVMYPSIARGLGGQVIHAVQVRSVVSGSAAERHGLQVADQIVSIDGRAFTATDPLEDFAGYVTGKRQGDQVDLVVMRQAQEKKIKLTLGQRPADLMGRDYRAQERFEQDFKIWLDESSERLRKEK